MLRLSPPLTIKLAAGELLACPHGGVTLRMISGRAWVTQRNDLDDHFLQPGQTFELQPGAQTLIGAEQETWLRLESQRGWAARLWQRLTGPAHTGQAPGRATSPAATVAG